jgi:hypothetical protein
MGLLGLPSGHHWAGRFFGKRSWKKFLSKFTIHKKKCIVEIIFSALLKPSFSRCSHTLYIIWEGDPLSPPEGEAPQGEHPLDPHFSINLLWAIAMLGDARAAGVEARCAVAPKSDSLVPYKDFNRAIFSYTILPPSCATSPPLGDGRSAIALVRLPVIRRYRNGGVPQWRGRSPRNRQSFSQ